MSEKKASGVSHVCILLSSSANIFKKVLLWKDVERPFRSRGKDGSFAVGPAAGMRKQLEEEPIFLTLDSLFH